MPMRRLKQSLAYIYHQYELATCINMCEPWERNFINGSVLVILTLLVFSSCVYLPNYMQTLLQLITPMPRNSPSSYTSPQTPKMSIG